MRGIWKLNQLLFLTALFLPFAATAGDGGTVDAGSPGTVQSAPPIPAERMPTLSLKVEPKEVSVGEVVYYRLNIKRRVADRVHLGSSASFGSLEVRSKEVKTLDTSGDWIQETLEVQLIGFIPEDVTIPSQKLTVVDNKGNLGEIQTEETQVSVKSHIANEPEPALKADQGPGEKVFEKDYTLLWVLGILGGAGIVVLLTLLIRWLWARRRPKPEPPPPPPRPAEEIALEKLTALKQSKLLEEGHIKEFHVRLSETIREYVGNRYRFDSLELSTEELVSKLGSATIEPDEYTNVVAFLSETDLVKFAKMILTLDESDSLLAKSFEFVEKTTPKPKDPRSPDA